MCIFKDTSIFCIISRFHNSLPKYFLLTLIHGIDSNVNGSKNNKSKIFKTIIKYSHVCFSAEIFLLIKGAIYHKMILCLY